MTQCPLTQYPELVYKSVITYPASKNTPKMQLKESNFQVSKLHFKDE